jgi:hypothetical protein
MGISGGGIVFANPVSRAIISKTPAFAPWENCENHQRKVGGLGGRKHPFISYAAKVKRKIQ